MEEKIMHLAVCDDNIADRKQLERLLGRESDRRLSSTGVFYVDSFGNKTAILNTPMIYDGLFLDMTEDGKDAVEIANMLRADGSMLPIIFCCSKVDYRKAANLPENCFFLDKPIGPDALAQMCDQLLSIKGSQVKKLELRSDTETFYLEEAEIMYAHPEHRAIQVHLCDGSERKPIATMLNFCSTLGFNVDDSARGTTKADLGYIRISDSGLLAMIGCSSVVNLKCVEKVGLFHLLMTDGTKIRISPSSRETLQQACRQAKDSR